VKAVRTLRGCLESLGHHVEEAEPKVDGMQLAPKDFHNPVVRPMRSGTVSAIKRADGLRGTHGFELDTQAMAASHASRASEYVESYLHGAGYTHALANSTSDYD